MRGSLRCLVVIYGFIPVGGPHGSADSASMAFTNEQDALSWVEKELRAREVKSRTYAVEYED